MNPIVASGPAGTIRRFESVRLSAEERDARVANHFPAPPLTLPPGWRYIDPPQPGMPTVDLLEDDPPGSLVGMYVSLGFVVLVVLVILLLR